MTYLGFFWSSASNFSCLSSRALILGPQRSPAHPPLPQPVLRLTSSTVLLPGSPLSTFASLIPLQIQTTICSCLIFLILASSSSVSLIFNHFLSYMTKHGKLPLMPVGINWLGGAHLIKSFHLLRVQCPTYSAKIFNKLSFVSCTDHDTRYSWF